MEGKIKLELETLNASLSVTSHVQHEVDQVDLTSPGCLLYRIGTKEVGVPWWRVVKVITDPEGEER